MAYTPIPIGSLAWGASVNAAFTSQDSRISALESAGDAPATQGLKAAPFDVALSNGSVAIASGTVHMVEVVITEPTTLNSAVAVVFTAGSGLTSAQNFAALYNAAGTRIAVTADQTTAWGTAGVKTMAFTAPVAVAAGRYYVALLSNGTTPPAFLRGLSAGAIPQALNIGRTAADGRWTTGPTAQTTLPASVTMASRTLAGAALWAGVA